MAKTARLSVKKVWLLLVVVAVIVLLIGGVLGYILAETSSRSTVQPAESMPINSFQECANAGYPVQQSYPEVCSVPGGKSFTND